MRVLLADSQAKERAALRRLLEQDLELYPVAEATAIEDLLAEVQKIQPDLVLPNWELPGIRESGFLSALHLLYHPPKVIAFSEHVEAHG